jgi:hypothetical protein
LCLSCGVRSSKREGQSLTFHGGVVEVKAGVIGSDPVALFDSVAANSYDQRGRGIDVSWSNGALHCNVWINFVVRHEVKLQLKGGHVVSDMTEGENR